MRRSFAVGLAALFTASAMSGELRVSALRQDQTIRGALDRGEYEEAERQAVNWQAHVQKKHGPDPLELARASDLLVEALIRNGKSATPSVLDAAEGAVRLKERRFATDPAELAISIHNL